MSDAPTPHLGLSHRIRGLVQPDQEPTPVGGRPAKVQFFSIVYTYDMRHPPKLSFQRVIERIRAGNLPGTVPDDDGRLMEGRVIPDTVVVDGFRIGAMMELDLKPEHRVSKIFGLPDDPSYVAPEKLAAIVEEITGEPQPKPMTSDEVVSELVRVQPCEPPKDQ
jgi:hypothetical protein